MSYRNLYNETEKILQENGKTWDDVEWVGVNFSGDLWNEPNQFTIPRVYWKHALDKQYDAGYGGQEVSAHLQVVGKDWWLERHEYDGAEWWEFKTLPTKPNDEVKFNEWRIFDNDWND